MSATYNELRQAVAQRKQVECVYHGARRLLCPHVIGWKNGREKILTFQFAGQTSKKPLPPGGEWRCMFVDEVTGVVLRDGDWHTGGRHTQPQTCVDHIDLEVTY